MSNPKEYLKNRGYKNLPIDIGVSGCVDVVRMHTSDAMKEYADIFFEDIIQAEIKETEKLIEQSKARHNDVSYLEYEVKVYRRLLELLKK